MKRDKAHFQIYPRTKLFDIMISLKKERKKRKKQLFDIMDSWKIDDKIWTTCFLRRQVTRGEQLISSDVRPNIHRNQNQEVKLYKCSAWSLNPNHKLISIKWNLSRGCFIRADKFNQDITLDHRLIHTYSGCWIRARISFYNIPSHHLTECRIPVAESNGLTTIKVHEFHTSEWVSSRKYTITQDATSTDGCCYSHTLPPSSICESTRTQNYELACEELNSDS